MEWFDFKLFLCWRARPKTFKRHNHWSQQHKENCRPGCPVRSIVYCSWAETGIMCLIKTGRKLLRMSQASKKTLDGCPRQLRLADWARQRWDCVRPWIEPSRLVGWFWEPDFPCFDSQCCPVSLTDLSGHRQGKLPIPKYILYKASVRNRLSSCLDYWILLIFLLWLFGIWHIP